MTPQNALTTEGVEMLIEALKDHPTLEQLHLNNVRCGTKGCNAIFSALLRNRVLKVLSLGSNDVRALVPAHVDNPHNSRHICDRASRFTTLQPCAWPTRLR